MFGCLQRMPGELGRLGGPLARGECGVRLAFRGILEHRRQRRARLAQEAHPGLRPQRLRGKPLQMQFRLQA